MEGHKCLMRTDARTPKPIFHTHKDTTMSYASSRKTSNTTQPPRARAVLALIFCAALGVPAIFAEAAAPASTIDITKFAFAPKEITVAPGTTIVWINHDDTPHSVAS